MRRGNQFRLQTHVAGSRTDELPSSGAETRRFALIKTHLCHRGPHHSTPEPRHARAGGARSRAISDRIFWNICRGTATSAQLEDRVEAVADDLGPDLDQLLAQAGQLPRLCRLGHRQRPHELAQVVGQRMELEADGVGGEGAARQPGPFDRALALLDPILRVPRWL
jgi:hypothetical protein